MKALLTAASGMMAQELNVEIISNNIANMRTTGYKRQRAEFQDLLYNTLRPAGTTSSASGTIVPSGIQVGSGVKTAATYRIMSQGATARTEKELDLAIRGEGFFQIVLPDGRMAYSRDGSFELDPDGTLVTLDGYTIQPGLTVPENALSVTINTSGQVQANMPDQQTPQTIGTIQLARFVNSAGLSAIGDNLFLATDGSGHPQIGDPNNQGFGNLLQYHLEQSNVNAVSEISDLIAAQRAYEMTARIMSAADQMMQATSNLR
ncbi:MAG: flagellar basal-body rod protein FlgG [Alphaproteobacteria bacterium]|nr:flagellar basal-body rod protein FlgG [Alphaproteobacteria bacterium]